MNILFVCKYNRFRSKIAESLFNKLNKDKKNKAKSAGIIKGNPLDKNQQKIAKKLGILIKNPPRGLSSKILKWQDLTIIVADDVSKEIFKSNKKYGKKTLIWKIPDAKTNKKEEIVKIIESIKLNMEKFLLNE